MRPRALKRGTLALATGSRPVRAALLILLALVIVSAQLAPSVVPQRRDGGIAAYTAKIVLEGGRLYVDAWDNKLPGIYYIDALAFLLFGVNRWALWLMETLFLYGAALLMYYLLDALYHRAWLVWSGTLLFVLLTRHPGLVSDIGFTEPHALLPQMICFVAGYQFLRQPQKRWGFILGAAAAAALVIKQTTIGVALAALPTLALSRHAVTRAPQRWAWLGATVAGGAATLGVISGFLLAQGILDDAIEASFVMASEFHQWVGEGAGVGHALLTTLIDNYFLISIAPFLPFVILGAVTIWRRVRARPYSGPPSAGEVVRLWAVVTFVVDLLLANITGRGYAHYYVSLIPATVLLVVEALPVLARLRERAAGRKRIFYNAARFYLVALALVPVFSMPVRFWLAAAGREVAAGPEQVDRVVAYVQANTLTDDQVLVWGANSAINFQSGRDSPTRYHYAYPLIVPDDATEANIDVILEDLREQQPAMIVDSASVDGDRVPPLDPIRRVIWWAKGGRYDIANLTSVYLFVMDHCEIVKVLDGVVIYQCAYTEASSGTPADET